MKHRSLSALVTVTALMCATAALSHHSISVIDISQAVWVKGAVVKYRSGAPHALLEIEVPGSAGKPVRWIMEGPFPGRMARIIAQYGGNPDAYLKPGDSIEVCGFRPKAGYDMQRSYSDVSISAAHFIHAQILVMPDGQMRAWGPYGKLDNCVRERDKVDVWREFLNRDALAHDLWCSGLRTVQNPSGVPKSFVENINRGLAAPCQ